MADVQLKRIDKSFGAVKVIKGIDLDIDARRVRGLRRALGLRQVDAAADDRRARGHHRGRHLHRRQATSTTSRPRDRGIAMVFQSYALYPHMTRLREHGLRAAGSARCRKAEIATRKVARGGAHAADRAAARAASRAQLSGGQRQRVAIGRAIVRQPEGLPVRRAAVEPRRRAARRDARSRSRELHRELGATMIYVTHDQVEAMTLADKIVVLNAAGSQQVGPPLELYHRPGEPLRRRLHRLAQDEPAAGRPHGRRRRRDRGRVVGARPTGFHAGPAASGLPGDLMLGIRPQAIRLTEPEASMMPCDRAPGRASGRREVISARAQERRRGARRRAGRRRRQAGPAGRAHLRRRRRAPLPDLGATDRDRRRHA